MGGAVIEGLPTNAKSTMMAMAFAVRRKASVRFMDDDWDDCRPEKRKI
jgi:hypothetical protein